MTQQTDGSIRYVKLDAADRLRDMSDEMDPTVLDNIGSPRYYMHRELFPGAAGNVQDDPVEFYDDQGKPSVFSGKADEILEVQAYEDAAYSLDTSDMTDWAIKGTLAIKGADGDVTEIPHTLRLRHRITQTGVNPHPRGLEDDGDVVANQWNPVLRFAFRPGTSFMPHGRQKGSVHDDQV